MAVDLLAEAQQGAVAHRRIVMMQIAQTAKSVKEGKASIDKADEYFNYVFDLFYKSEKIQNELASLLQEARDVLAKGQTPDMTKIISAYAKLQDAYNRILVQLAQPEETL